MTTYTNLKYNTVKTRVYNFILILTGIFVFIFNYTNIGIFGWKETTAFVLMYFLSQLMPARLPQGDIFSLTIFFDMALIVLFGAPFAITVSFGVTLIARICRIMFGLREPIWDMLRNASKNAVVIALTGLVYSFLNNRLIAFIMASVTYFSIHLFFLLADSTFNSKRPVGRWLSVDKLIYVNYTVLTIMAFIMTMIYKGTSSEWKLFVILLFFVPILLVTHSFKLYADIKQSYLNTVKTVAAAIEANDSYTKGHTERVSEYSLALGKELGLPQRELQKLQYVALLHDVGKIGISETILNKPGALSLEEYEEIKKHSEIGAEILAKIKFLSNKSDIVLHHHEKYNGSGYPAGLKGVNVPLESRILSVADAYDAMTTDRPYRLATTPRMAVDELTRCAGSQFDPELVEKFKSVLRKMGEI